MRELYRDGGQGMLYETTMECYLLLEVLQHLYATK